MCLGGIASAGLAAFLARLRPHLKPVVLEYKKPLYSADVKIVFDIETGVASLMNTTVNGQAAEVGTIGNEGVFGIPLLLGDDPAPTSVYI